MILPLLSMMFLVASLFTWGAFYSSVLGYQSARVSQDTTQQFLLSEYVLAQAAYWLQQTPMEKLPAPVITCIQYPCILQAQTPAYYPQQPVSWWKMADNPSIIAVTMDIPSPHRAYYAVEQLMEPSTVNKRYYRVTAWALLASQTMPSIVQGVWMKALEISEYQRLSWREWKN